MQVKVQSLTCKSNDFNVEEMQKIVGTYAGVCYMPNTYDALAQDTERAIKRAKQTIAMGHHSIADHFQISIVLEDIPKAVAMVLNSLGFYTTSEKSGRYTSCDSVLQKEELEGRLWGKKSYGILIPKWNDIFYKLIKDKYSDMDDKQATKLANENTRYLLSVFAPFTTMVYTTSIRQWNYLLSWVVYLSEYVKMYKDDLSPFIVRLSLELDGLADKLQFLYIEGLEDTKRLFFPFLDDLTETWTDVPEYWGMSYTVKYSCSFVALAQLQRHRTIDYFMQLSDDARFYVPPILEGTEYLQQWVYANMVMYPHYPAGILVNVTECGTVPNFILKCEERNCGRAQYETAMNTVHTYSMLKALGDDSVKQYLKQFGDDILTKGQLLHCCKEPCYFGCSKALDFAERLV